MLKLRAAKFTPCCSQSAIQKSRPLKKLAVLGRSWRFRLRFVQGQEFLTVAKTWAGVVELQEACKDALRMAGVEVSCS